MSLCNRLIGGVVDGLMIAIDTITSFWQTPREVEWAKAAADGLAEREAETEVAEPLSHWKVGDSYCGLCGENITAVSFHACPMRTKPEPEATSKRYSIEDVFDLRNQQYDVCGQCRFTRRDHQRPYTGACKAFVDPKTPAAGAGAGMDPRAGSPPTPARGVSTEDLLDAAECVEFWMESDTCNDTPENLLRLKQLRRRLLRAAGPASEVPL